MSTSKQRHPAIELLARYKAVFGAAWAYRAELAGPKRMADEVAFLPAALSLVETPVHPAPRRFAYAIMVLFGIALVWACIGTVDIVAVAPGRIIVSDRTKVIQPLEASVVRKVLVKDGDRVQAGQVLVELDPTIATADKTAVQDQLTAAASEVMRTGVLLQLLSNQKQDNPILRGLEADLPNELYAKTVAPSTGTTTIPWTTAEQAAAQAQLLAEWQDINAKLAKLDAEASRRNAEIGTVQQTVAKLSATVPMAQTREDDFKKLVAQGFVSSHMTQDKTRERVELERDLSTTQARLLEAQSTLRETQQARVAFRMETQRLLNDRQAQAASKLQQLAQDQTKAAQRERQTQLIAPVAGVIQQLAIHSVGGVVTSAQPLMIVVPESATVTAEISIANQDIGFVNAGQSAEVKLETFSYTKYGTVTANVDMVTADAVTDEKKGSYYPATLTLAKSDMLVDGKRVHISPGMNITAEIKTGQRRIIEYLLSAVQRAGSESLRER
ncbi:HlyD family type I secretion periplasmic adaptor subunit [Aquabacterium sp.]|uniref:HlyD family type I secretion periplasmic adaptor subunit n=1 Tax=Aquabacterium sp. TaxID=1872578 RepID=UPI0019BE4665|nr:HlyD family type I secretion periplasmic adaptor subunit [Aquabacterium sp.]MBC7700527.1 HlyD family type I secretion periplasmic adaptor subunit [Aquabacterium sp.]